MSSRILTAIVVAVAIVVWLLTGLDASREEADASTVAAQDELPPLVRAVRSQARMHLAVLPVRGVTEANRVVDVRAEVAGKIVSLPGLKGIQVQAGNLLCGIAIDSRESDLKQALALERKASLEYEGFANLGREGLQSEINLAQARASLESAKATTRRAELALKKTHITAPFGGIVESQPVEIGDFLSPGATCVTLMEIDPIVVTGRIAERSIRAIKPGDEVMTTLFSGEKLPGTISYIAHTPSGSTRTYTVEVTVPNPEGRILAGMTAEMAVPMARMMAHLISSASLILSDDGEIGIRHVGVENRVSFSPIKILSEEEGRVWVSGLPEDIKIITVGQEDVFRGQVVRVDMSALNSVVSN